MSSASKHKKEAVEQGMHWIKAQLPLGSLGVSEVTQLCSTTGGFHSEISFTPCESLKEVSVCENKGKNSHVPIITMRLCCQLLPSGESMHRFQKIYLGSRFSGAQTHRVLSIPATKKGSPLQLQCGLNTSGTTLVC